MSNNTDNVLTLSELLNRNVTSTKAILANYLGEGNDSIIPTLSSGLDYRECNIASNGSKYYLDEN